MSPEECAFQDWRAVGQADGAQGAGVERFRSYTRACSRHGIAPDFNAYERGREEGLRTYCTPNGIYAAGIRGRGNIGECPYDPVLLRIHQVTTTFARADQALNHITGQQNRISSDLRRTRTRIFDIQDDLIDRDDLSSEEREDMRDELEDLRDRLSRFEGDEISLRYRVRRAEEERGLALQALRRLELELSIAPIL